jgi:hypothetical protein
VSEIINSLQVICNIQSIYEYSGSTTKTIIL